MARNLGDAVMARTEGRWHRARIVGRTFSNPPMYDVRTSDDLFIFNLGENNIVNDEKSPQLVKG